MVVEISEETKCDNCGGVKVLRDRFEPPTCASCGRGEPTLELKDVEWLADEKATGGNPLQLNATTPPRVEAVLYCQPHYFSVKPVFYEVGFSYVYRKMQKSSLGFKYRILSVDISQELEDLISNNKRLLRAAKWTQRGWQVL